MSVPVLFLPLRPPGKEKRSLPERLERNLAAWELPFAAPGKLIAVKVHFGEDGLVSYMPPTLVRRVVGVLKQRGARPFLTDTTTLYRGRRGTAVGHLELALEHGFGYEAIGAPLLIADGLKGRDVVRVPVAGRHFREVEIAGSLAAADGLVVVSHVKGHIVAGFGGALKNLAMGFGSRRAKQLMHADVRPALRGENACTGCATCVAACPTSAARIVSGVAAFDPETCIGCAECITLCPEGALRILWNSSPAALQEKMAETAAGALRGRAGQATFVNFILSVTPECDCMPFGDLPIVPDVGILIADDPVAIDQASADLVNAQPGVAGSVLGQPLAPGADKWRAIYPEVDWTIQLARAEELGLGRRDYRLVAESE